MIVATITGTTWLMTFMGIGVVFVILVLLIFVLSIFSITAKKSTRVVKKQIVKHKEEKAERVIANASEEEKEIIAVAVALYLNLEETHDRESGVLTIHHTQYTQWHSVLNPVV